MSSGRNRAMAPRDDKKARSRPGPSMATEIPLVSPGVLSRRAVSDGTCSSASRIGTEASSPTLLTRVVGNFSPAHLSARFPAEPPSLRETEDTTRSVPGSGRSHVSPTMTSRLVLPMMVIPPLTSGLFPRHPSRLPADVPWRRRSAVPGVWTSTPRTSARSSDCAALSRTASAPGLPVWARERMRDGCCPALSVVVTSSSVAANPASAKAFATPSAVQSAGASARTSRPTMSWAPRQGMPRDASASATAVVVAPEATISAWSGNWSTRRSSRSPSIMRMKRTTRSPARHRCFCTSVVALLESSYQAEPMLA